jgi:uncharacterized membrane protein YsdA (DUF1294 family)
MFHVKLLYIYVLWNFITLGMMAWDKHRAKKHKSRISEASLLWSAFAMGAMGTTVGALLFHHKTRKMKFQILLPLALLGNLFIYVFVRSNIGV